MAFSRPPKRSVPGGFKTRRATPSFGSPAPAPSKPPTQKVKSFKAPATAPVFKSPAPAQAAAAPRAQEFFKRPPAQGF